MPSVNRLPESDRAEIIGRLQRIEGQARGIQKMFEDDRECVDVMNQIAAVKAAVNTLSASMFEAFALHCARHPEEFADAQESLEAIVKTLVRAGK
jgi:CsoR family transcriptional regulator, copper-sensing transcriptional repressor